MPPRRRVGKQRAALIDTKRVRTYYTALNAMLRASIAVAHTLYGTKETTIDSVPSEVWDWTVRVRRQLRLTDLECKVTERFDWYPRTGRVLIPMSVANAEKRARERIDDMALRAFKSAETSSLLNGDVCGLVENFTKGRCVNAHN